MITEEMKSTLLDVEINNPEGIQNLKALLKNYSDIINKDQSTLSEEDGAKLTDVTYVRTVGLAKFLYDDQGYLAGIREYGHYIAAKALDIKSESDYMNHYNDIRLICNEL